MILSIDASAGLSGDMLLAGFLDLGLPLDHVTRLLQRLRLFGVRIKARRLRRQGEWATQVSILLETRVVPGPRSLQEILDFVKGSALPASLQRAVLRVIRTLARAEGEIHRRPLRRVVFHQLGEVDTLAAVTGFCAGLSRFRIRSVHCSPIPLGCRHQDPHGRWRASPGPATQRLLTDFPTYLCPDRFEWTTPTGAALVAAFGCNGEPPSFRVRGVGRAVGHNCPPHGPSVLRLLLGEPL